MNNLDENVNAYKKEFEYDFDNDIMLKYYPKRIIEKLVEGSFLELLSIQTYTFNYLDKRRSTGYCRGPQDHHY